MSNKNKISAGMIFIVLIFSTVYTVSAQSYWQYMILDADPMNTSMGSFAVGDVNKDGNVELLAGGDQNLMWYRPSTFERGVIGPGDFHVGLIVADIDKDEVNEVICGELNPETEKWMITWYKPQKDLTKPWKRHILDPECLAGAHCIIMKDLNGDGVEEIIANATYAKVWGVFAYFRTDDITRPWKKITVQTGYMEEGLAADDLNGDGLMDIVSGTSIYYQKVASNGARSWKRYNYAHNFREMVRVALADITGNGQKDILIAESEFPDGILSWFENRNAQDPKNPWVEHRIFAGLNFAHSYEAFQIGKGQVRLFLGEMMKGGWDAPYNFDARMMEFTTTDRGKIWKTEILHKGVGSHEATEYDIDGDGQYEIVGKAWGKEYKIPKVQIWKKKEGPCKLTQFKHVLLDREKPYTGADILDTDVDGDGKKDVVCGAWWYRNGDWQRYTIPNIYQVHVAYDIDRDGRDELIATREFPTESSDWYPKLSGDLCWLKSVDPVNGKWQEYDFGRGSNGWPHGVGIGPVLPDGQLAFFATYHGQGHPMFKIDTVFVQDLNDGILSKKLLQEFKNNNCPLSKNAVIDMPRGKRWSITDKENEQLYNLFVKNDKLEVRGGYPEIFEIPKDPKKVPWPKRTLAPISYGEEFLTFDLDNDGDLDIMAGPYWLENKGDGSFIPHRIIDENLNVQVARIRLADINEDKHMDLVIVEEDLSYEVRQAFFARFAWFENPGNIKKAPWKMHIIDRIRSPHSLDVADFDGDGDLEIVCAEHDPFKPYRSRSRTFIYKKAKKNASAWYRYLLDERFEQHCGTKTIELGQGKLGIMGHGWMEPRYVHLWIPVE